MNGILFDAELRAKLHGGESCVDMFDEAGKPVGHFLPHGLYMQLMIAELAREPTEAELEAGRLEIQRTGGTTTEHVLARLEQVRLAWEARQ